MGVVVDYQVAGNNPSVVGGTGVAIKYFPRLLGSSIGVQSVAPSATSAVGQLAVPGYNILNGQNFGVFAAGNIGSDLGDPSGTFSVLVQAQTSANLAAPKYITLASIAATVPGFSGGNSWSIKLSLYGDTTSGIVGGSFTSYVNGVKVGTPPTNSTNVLTGINFNNNVGSLASASGGAGSQSGQPPFGLVVGVQFGTSDPTNIANLYQFQLVQL